MKNEHFEELETLDVNNFWFKAKEKYLDSIIRTHGSVILDVGCGSGRTMVSFIARNYKVLGVDINEMALSLCSEKGYKVFKADLQKETISDLNEVPDYITALDFVEHIENPVKVLLNLKKISDSHTQLIVTVPSYNFLYSDWDKAMGHIKRYNRSLLCDELQKGGWEVSRATYIHFLPLVPALIQRKIIFPLIKLARPFNESMKEKFFNPRPFLNRLLYYLYYPEFYLFKKRLPLPLGLSVLAIAVPKKEEL